MLNNNKAFTMIELMIAITIVAFLMIATYAPYSYYQNKAKVKIATREISQVLYEAKNMAINWAVYSTWNISIWVYFDNTHNNKIKIFSYTHNILESDIDRNTSLPDINIIKEVKIQNSVEIDNIDVDWILKDNFLFFFDSISWELKYYSWNMWVKEEITPVSDNVDINISYKWSSSSNLQRTLSYYTTTNIIDY